MKKKLTFIFLICILLFIALSLREIIINYDKLFNNSNKFTRDEIITLLDKGANYNNYYRLVNTQNGKEEFFYKDGILVSFINSKLNYWMNLTENDKEMIIIDNFKEKTAYTVKDFDKINFPIKNDSIRILFYCI